MNRVVVAVVALAVLILSLPWIAYGVGLVNVTDRPAPPLEKRVSAEQLELLHVTLRKAGVFKVEPLSPWDYAIALVREPEALDSAGMKAAGIVAEEYVLGRLRRSEPILHDLSVRALTIWLTQNWTTDEVLTRAVQIEQVRSLRRR